MNTACDLDDSLFMLVAATVLLLLPSNIKSSISYSVNKSDICSRGYNNLIHQCYCMKEARIHGTQHAWLNNTRKKVLDVVVVVVCLLLLFLPFSPPLFPLFHLELVCGCRLLAPARTGCWCSRRRRCLCLLFSLLHCSPYFGFLKARLHVVAM